jgi:UDP-galactopyranose mutase
MTKQYDYLIVGAGLFGSVFARLATDAGLKCLIIERRDHIGGNIYTKEINNINVHYYGPHIFHTSNRQVWEIVNTFARFNHFVYSPIASFKGRLYNLPFNMNTFYQLWGVKTPQEAKKEIERQKAEYKGIIEPQNLEEQALMLGGRDIYETLIKGYSEKQWGRKATDLPAFIIRRLPFRYTFNNNYFNDPFQGIPIGGYTRMCENIIKDVDMQLNTDFFTDREYYLSLAHKVVYTGAIDAFYDYCYGQLQYRSLRFDHHLLNGIPDFQGVAAMNFTDAETPYTRVVEHKHFEFGTQPDTVITYEYPTEWQPGNEPYYPINDETNTALYARYKALADSERQIIFGGRLAEYKYYDMDKVIAQAMIIFNKYK